MIKTMPNSCSTCAEFMTIIRVRRRQENHVAVEAWQEAYSLHCLMEHVRA